MKVKNIQNFVSEANNPNAKAANTNNKNNNNAHNSTSFAGATDSLVKFWEAVDRGGLAASFTVQDMLGTNIPRTWAARNVGKEYTGKNNWVAVMENGLREFLTGPSMFVVPGAVLYSTMKFAGKAHGVPVQTINDFTQLVSGSQFDTSTPEAFKKQFYAKVLDKVFSNFDAPSADINTQEYVDKILKMESAKKKGLMNNIKGKSMPDSKEEILQSIVDTFVKDKKANTKGYPDFLKALITDVADKDKAGKYEIKIDDLIDRMGKYADDLYETLQKQGGELTEDFINSFAKKRMGGRFATNIAMGAFTAAFMWFIPKIYTIGKTNPETDPVRQKASELKGGAKVQNTTQSVVAPAPVTTDAKNNSVAPQAQNSVNFTGGGVSKLMQDLGDKVAPGADNFLSKHAGSLESNWINVSRPIFYCLITGFTLLPRLIQSTKRDIESSKKNGGPIQWDETSNILRRDVTTILTILFAMEGLGAGMAHSASKRKGIILTNKILPDNVKFFDKMKEFLNPEGGVKVLSKKNNTAQMSSFANGSELLRFFEDTEAKKGNLYKLLHIDANAKNGQESLLYNAAKNLFGEELLNKKDLRAQDLAEDLLNVDGSKTKELNELLDVLNDTSKNPLLKFANKINAMFETVSLAIVTAFLGFGLPKLNELLIKNKYLKDNDTLKNPDMPIPAHSLLNDLKPIEKQTFQYFLGNAK